MWIFLSLSPPIDSACGMNQPLEPEPESDRSAPKNSTTMLQVRLSTERVVSQQVMSTPEIRHAKLSIYKDADIHEPGHIGERYASL